VSVRRSRSSSVPFDLILVLVYLALVNWLLASGSLGAAGSTSRILLTLPLLVFVPGYSLAAAAFPNAPLEEDRGSLLDRVRERPSGVDTTERVALGFGLSVLLLPIVGILVAFEPGPFTLDSSVVALSGVGALFTLVAAVRRWRLPADERYAPPLDRWGEAVGRTAEGSTTDVLLSVGLGVSIVLALVAGGYAVANPLDAQEFSTLGAGHLDETGDFVLGPSDALEENVTEGESVDSAFYVKNQEGSETEYTVIVQVQRVDDDGNPVRVSEINRYRQTLAPSEEWIQPHSVTLGMAGENVRIAYLLYEGPVPAGANIGNADYWADHSVTVVDEGD
jgi:uncharacterized membrane protein